MALSNASLHRKQLLPIFQGYRLDIPSLERTDVGEYTCIAENEVGTGEASILVDVLGTFFAIYNLIERVLSLCL